MAPLRRVDSRPAFNAQYSTHSGDEGMVSSVENHRERNWGQDLFHIVQSLLVLVYWKGVVDAGVMVWLFLGRGHRIVTSSLDHRLP